MRLCLMSALVLLCGCNPYVPPDATADQDDQSVVEFSLLSGDVLLMGVWTFSDRPGTTAGDTISRSVSAPITASVVIPPGYAFFGWSGDHITASRTSAVIKPRNGTRKVALHVVPAGDG